MRLKEDLQDGRALVDSLGKNRSFEALNLTARKNNQELELAHVTRLGKHSFAQMELLSRGSCRDTGKIARFQSGAYHRNAA